MQLLDWRSPDLRFDVSCSKGAYIRVLAEDLAAQLGTLGHLAALQRLTVAPFTVEPQWSFEVLEAMSAAQREALLLPVDAALCACRRFDVPAGGVSALRQGQTLNVALELPGMVRIYAAGLGFLGLGEIEAAGLLKPLRLISSVTNRA
jgi:tRNA pseudouridine55 synthase